MGSEKIVLKGNFRGYYRTNQSNTIGAADYYDIQWDKLILESAEKIDDYSSSDNKKGLYSYVKSIKNFEVSSDLNINNEKKLEDVLLKDFTVVKSIREGNVIYVEVEGQYFSRFPYKPEIKKPISIKNNDGCLKPFSVILAITLLYFSLVIFKDPLILMLSVLLSIFIFFYGRVLKFRSSFFAAIIGLLLTLSLIGSMIYNFSNNKNIYTSNWSNSSKNKSKNHSNSKDNSNSSTSTSSSNSTWDSSTSTSSTNSNTQETDYNLIPNNEENLDYLSHYHEWSDYSNNFYHENFDVSEYYYNQSKINRENINVNNSQVIAAFDEYFYETVHSNTFNFDQNKLSKVLAMYNKVKNKYALNRFEFANAIVSSVQSIPYNYILTGECNYETNPENKGCIDFIKFGFFSPVEFMKNFKGDCDTKALFCFYILDKFDYDVALLVSFEYKHAILGINLNVGGGKYKTYKRKRYYTWETTSENFRAGMLSPNISNLEKFRVELINKS